MKKTPIIATFLLLALAVPTFVFAGPGYHRGGGPADGRAVQQPVLSPEKQEVFKKIMADQREKARPLHKQMAEKRMELEYLSRLDKTEPQAIRQLIGETSDLGDKLQQLRQTTGERLEKEVGPEAGSLYRHRHDRGHNCGPCGFDGPRFGHGPQHPGRW